MLKNRAQIACRLESIEKIELELPAERDFGFRARNVRSRVNLLRPP